MRQAATAGLLFACRLLSGLWSALWYLAVLLGLLLFVSRDFFPKRKSKPLTSQAPVRHKELHPYHSRPHLRRNGSEVFWEMPDGEIIPLEGIEPSLVLQEVASAVGGALTYELTKLR
jgi:hypothetical protein